MSHLGGKFPQEHNPLLAKRNWNTIAFGVPDDPGIRCPRGNDPFSSMILRSCGKPGREGSLQKVFNASAKTDNFPDR